MTTVIDNLKTQSPKMQIELLDMYLLDAKDDGDWHLAHEIEERLAALKSEHEDVAATIVSDKAQRAAESKAKAEERARHSFVARGID